MDQKTAAYRLDHKRKYRFYLRMCFNLIDVTHVNSYIVYTKLGDDITEFQNCCGKDFDW